MTGELTVLQAGSVFHGRYEVVRCIRRGGMGAVYEVNDANTNRRRALKVMLPKSVTDPDLRARFKQEATITAGVRSDHTVEIFDAGIDAATGSPFLLMELLEGEDLSTVLERGPLDPTEAARILGQLARVLDKTHAAGIVHRDLKPENLFLADTDDPFPRLKVLDFGVAKLVAEEGAANTTRVLGTPLYMSKEQIMGDGSIGPAADLYAMAHIAYAMLTGRPYWLDEATSSPAPYVFMSKVMAGAPEPATERARRYGVELPPAFNGWFAQATDLDPMLRFQRASELLRELDPILGTTPSKTRPSRPSLAEVSARPSTTDPNTLTQRSTVGRRFPAAPIGVVLAIGLVVTLGLVSRNGEAPAQRASSEPAAPARQEVGAAPQLEASITLAATTAPIAALESPAVTASPSATSVPSIPETRPTRPAAARPGRAGGFAPLTRTPAAPSSPPAARVPPAAVEPPDPTKVR